jgi:molecular chaperone DnaJ
MSKDYYKILGIEKNASAEDVKNAFRRLALQHHPDRGGDAEKFKEANEAYQVLSDSQKRAQYDRFGTVNEGPAGAGGFQGFGGFSGGSVNFEDLGDLFGGFGDLFGMGGQARAQDRRGRDIGLDANIGFLESVFGVDQAIDILKSVKCDHCLGTGGEPGSKQQSCPTCHGRGQVAQARNTMFGVIQTMSQCSTCHGAGRKYDKTCSICNGSGVARERRKMSVRIPAGISDGATIRVAGEGEAGERGTAAGDLYVNVRVKPDARWTRRGYDIVSEVKIPFADAALGTVVPVETVDGRVELKIPAGTQPGTVLKLKNRGVPHLNSSSRGDHMVTAVIEVPKKLSKKQKKLLEEFKKVA